MIYKLNTNYIYKLCTHTHTHTHTHTMNTKWMIHVYTWMFEWLFKTHTSNTFRAIAITHMHNTLFQLMSVVGCFCGCMVHLVLVANFHVSIFQRVEAILPGMPNYSLGNSHTSRKVLPIQVWVMTISKPPSSWEMYSAITIRLFIIVIVPCAKFWAMVICQGIFSRSTTCISCHMEGVVSWLSANVERIIFGVCCVSREIFYFNS